MVKKFDKSLASLVLLLGADLAYASGAEHGINWWHLGSAYKDSPALGWLFVTFLIFAFLIARAIKKPLSVYLKTRSEDIRRQIEEGAQARAESERKLKLYEDRLRTLSGEVEVLKSAFRQQAEDERAEKEQQARQSEARILRDVEDTIKSNFERSKNRLSQEVIEQAVAQAQKIIVDTRREEVDLALQERLLKDLKTSFRELAQ